MNASVRTNGHWCLPLQVTLMASIAVGGCAGMAPADIDPRLHEPPDSWNSQAAAGPVQPEWWERFDDTDLTALIARTAGESPTVLQAMAIADQARAQARIAGADRLPELAAAFSATRQKQAVPVLGSVGANGPTNTTATGTTYGLALNVSWEVDLWGRIATQTMAAREDFFASVANLRAVRQSIAAQTARTWFSVVEARAQVSLSERTVQALEETARQVGNRQRAGIGSPEDESLAIANLESARGGLYQRQENFERAVRQLQILARDYPSGRLATPSDLPGLPPMPPTGLPAELLARRPDVEAAARSVRATGLRSVSARRALLPGIRLTGSFGTQSNELKDLLDGNFSVWSIAGQLLQPVFQGGRLRANIELSDAVQREAVQTYAQTALQAFSEVETALASDEFILQREAALNRAAEAAQRAETIAFNRYKQGITPFLTVLESQRRSLDARSAFLAARRARLDNRIDLHLALGGGFDAVADNSDRDASP